MEGNGRIICGPPEPEELPGPGSPNYAQRMLDNLELYGDGVAQISQMSGESVTYKQIHDKVIKLAVALQKMGVKRGDVISMSSENRFEFTVCALAIIATGAINATLNVLYSRSELIHAMKISKPKFIFASPFTLYNIIDVFEDVPSLEKIISFGDEKPDSTVMLFDELFVDKVDVSKFKPVEVDIMTHPVAILCSSGTTGLAKGVVLTHRNFIVVNAHLRLLIDNVDSPDTCLLSLLPWFHAYGFITHLACLYLNLKLVFMVRFDENAFLRAIQDYKITITMLVPPLMVFLSKHPLVDKYDLSSLQEIWCGAAPLSKDTQVAVTKRIGVKRIKQGYGLTESTLAVIHNADNLKYGSCGKVVPGTKAKVVDLTTGETLGPFKEGELCFKGPLMMPGYLGDAAATENIFDSDGWLHSGDVGYYDNEEFFYIVDRIKELIKYKGFQVPPAEIEALLLEHPGVREAAVVGVPDERAGELPMAFITKQTASNVTEKELIDFVAKRVSQPKQLHGGVRFIEDIPKNPTGKILRRELRDLLTKEKSKL